MYICMLMCYFTAYSQQNQIATPANNVGNGDRAKYVIYLIGDGMGLAHTSLVEYFRAAKDDSTGFVSLEMDKMPVYGIATTHAKTRLITGSAAAGTALATGYKTHIDGIAYDSITDKSFESIASISKKMGEKVGIISSGYMNDATPAAFYANVRNRRLYDDIAEQLIKSNIDFFGGGGVLTSKKSKLNVKKALENEGYNVIENSEAFINLDDKSGKVYFFADDLTSLMTMPFRIDNKNQISLATITEKAIELLYNPGGFFLMVEGALIDWASHDNDAASVIYEVEDFDKAVKVAIDFYRQHPNETLVVVTSDHETGGLALGYKDMRYESDYDIIDSQKHSHTKMSQLIEQHFGKLNMKLKQGEQSQKLFDELGFSEELLKKSPKLKSILDKTYGSQYSLVANKNIRKINYKYFANDYVRAFNNFSGIDFTSYKHTALPVPVRAIGVGSENFNGMMDNTDIPKKIMKAKTLK